MDLVQILLLCVVGFSVLVFLFVNSLDSVEEGRKNSDDGEQISILLCDPDSQIKTWSCALEYVEGTDDQEEEKRGGGDKDGEKLAVSGIFEMVGSEGIEEREETEIDGVSSSEKSNFCSAVLGICGNNKGEILSSDMDINEGDDKVSEGDLEDWEGIERTELEKIFGKAVVFVGSKDNADRINGDVKLQLYGLQRIALEGVCYGSQPMALKVSARAKWNAWQKLGNMSREMAMEKYINILSEHIPEWKDYDINIPSISLIKGEGTYMRNIQDTSEDDRRSSQPNNYQV